MNKRNASHDPGDLMPSGDIRPLAEIEIGPAKHEKFLDQNYKKVAMVVIAAALIVSAIIVWRVLGDEKVRNAGIALSTAMSSEDGPTIESLDAVIKDYLGTNAATTAEYLKGQVYWQQGREDEGNKAMEDFIMRAPTQEWKAQAGTVLGCRYMNNGKLDDAVRCFETVTSTGADLYVPVALISLGDIARQQGNTEKALSYYDQVLQQYPGCTFSRVGDQAPGVEARKDLLTVKAPQPVRASVPAAPEVSAPSLQLPGSAE